MVQTVSNERLLQIANLLEAMRPKTKASADGLGLYLGDGMPRPGLGNLRTFELEEVVRELLSLREAEAKLASTERRMNSVTRDLLRLED